MSTFPFSNDRSSNEFASPLLTVQDILRLKADYEADMKLLEELPTRIKAKRRKYEASLLFAPPGFDPDKSQTAVAASVSEAPVVSAPPAKPPTTETGAEFELSAPADDAGSRLTWKSGLLDVLTKANTGLTHQDALAKLKETELGKRVSTGEKGFYNAVSFLDKSGQIVKHAGRLYAKPVYDFIKEKGHLPQPAVGARLRPGGSGQAVLDVLRKAPFGLDVNQLREQLTQVEGLPESVTKHHHYIYTVLGTLTGQGAIERDAKGVYKVKRGE